MMFRLDPSTAAAHLNPPQMISCVTSSTKLWVVGRLILGEWFMVPSKLPDSWIHAAEKIGYGFFLRRIYFSFILGVTIQVKGWEGEGLIGDSS
jgi:hypothetical protein